METIGQPWDRRRGESAEHHGLLRRYLEMGSGRKLADLAEAVGRPVKSVQRLSSQHDWVERAAAYDAHLDARVDALTTDAVAAMRLEHMRALEILRKHGIMLAAKERGTAGDGRAMIETAIRLERLLIGEATDRQEMRVQVESDRDLSVLTDDELATYRALLAKMAASRGE